MKACQVDQVVRDLLSRIINVMFHYECAKAQFIVRMTDFDPARRRHCNIVVREVDKDICDAPVMETVTVE